MDGRGEPSVSGSSRVSQDAPCRYDFDDGPEALHKLLSGSLPSAVSGDRRRGPDTKRLVLQTPDPASGRGLAVGLHSPTTSDDATTPSSSAHLSSCSFTLSLSASVAASKSSRFSSRSSCRSPRRRQRRSVGVVRSLESSYGLFVTSISLRSRHRCVRDLSEVRVLQGS